MTLNLCTLTREKEEVQTKTRLMPATTLATMSNMAFVLFCCVLLMLFAAPAWAEDQCSGALPVGDVTGCGALITVTGVDGNGNATFFTVKSLGNGNPFDGIEDTLVGIQNNSGATLNSITLTSPVTEGVDPLFHFDGDGVCSYNSADCFLGEGSRTGYEGPNNTFINIGEGETSGTVCFNCLELSGIADGQSTWFALEGTPDSLTSVSQTQPTPPGVTTTFDFGPFNFKSTPAPTTQNGNQLTITAVPIPAGTTINFPGGLSGTCIVYANTGENCRAFDVQCSGTSDCDGTYFAEFATSYDSDTILFPGFGKGEFACTLPFGTFSNQIDAFSQTRSDPTTKGKSGGTGSCWIAVQNVNYQNADLSIVNLASPKVKSGSNLSYGILVLNLGPNPATAVSVTDPVPNGTTGTLVSSTVCISGTSGVTCLSGNNSPCTLSAGVVTCQTGNLLPFSLQTLAAVGIQLTFTVNASAGSTITNTATVQALNPDPRTKNNSSTAVTKVK